MKVRAEKGFSGFLCTGEAFSMHSGEVREIERNDTVAELISIGYLREVADAPRSCGTDITQGEVKLDEAKRSKPKRS